MRRSSRSPGKARKEEHEGDSFLVAELLTEEYESQHLGHRDEGSDDDAHEESEELLEIVHCLID
jgi:hypothetical protein